MSESIPSVSATAVDLGELVDQDGRSYRLRLLDGPERVELADGLEPQDYLGDRPLTLEVEDLLAVPEPWQRYALRVHRGDFFFAIVIKEEDRERLQQSYLSRRARLRLRTSALA